MKRRWSFSTKVFLIISISILTPIFFMFIYLNSSFSSFLDEEISSKVSQTISGSEEQIYKKQENLINVSNIFYSDAEFQSAMTDDTKSYYEKCTYFDSRVANLIYSNVFDSDELKLTFFDKNQNLYTNWGINYNDYSFLLEEDWVKEAKKQDGYLVWNLFGESPFAEEAGKNLRSISLARFMDEGMMLISMDVSQLNQMLQQYKYSEKDMIFICSTGQSDDLLPEEVRAYGEQIYAGLKEKSGTMIQSIHHRKYLTYYYTLSNPLFYKNDDFKVVALIDYQNVAEKTQSYLMKTVVFFLAFSVFLILTVYVISQAIVKPIKVISWKVSNYHVKDKFQYQYPGKDEIGELYAAFEQMTCNINDLFEKLDHEYEVKERYRFELLRAQINPHFIFNTLNSIRWMAIIRKQDNIVESIDAMTDMLQYTMNKGSNEVTLKQELDSIRAYIYIQNLRYGGRCKLEVRITEELHNCRMLKFSLQPVVENCIIHGFKDLHTEGLIQIDGLRQGERLCLYVRNNGTLIADEALKKFEQEKGNGHRDVKQVTGIGMTNVDEIIRMTYGEEYGLHIYKERNMTVVKYILPYMEMENDEKGYDC